MRELLNHLLAKFQREVVKTEYVEVPVTVPPAAYNPSLLEWALTDRLEKPEMRLVAEMDKISMVQEGDVHYCTRFILSDGSAQEGNGYSKGDAPVGSVVWATHHHSYAFLQGVKQLRTTPRPGFTLSSQQWEQLEAFGVTYAVDNAHYRIYYAVKVDEELLPLLGSTLREDRLHEKHPVVSGDVLLCQAAYKDVLMPDDETTKYMQVLQVKYIRSAEFEAERLIYLDQLTKPVKPRTPVALAS